MRELPADAGEQLWQAARDATGTAWGPPPMMVEDAKRALAGSAASMFTEATRPVTDIETCGIGQPGHLCGEPAVELVAVHTTRNAWDDTEPSPGVVKLCERHRLGNPQPGRCGDPSPPLIQPKGAPRPVDLCSLDAGHAGWHRDAATGAEWSRT